MTGRISKDEPLSLRLTVYGVCLLLLLLTLGQLGKWYEQPYSWDRPFLTVLFLATAYGLFRMMIWARAAVIVMLWLFIFLLIVGLINPFMASDWMAAGNVPPSATTLVVLVAPFVATFVLCLHILGKYKKNFR